MGLFDIFRRHKKKEEEKTPDSSSAVVQSETAHEDESADTTSAAPASAPIHPEPVNIPPADSYEEKINPDGTRETLHNGVKEEETSEESHSEEVADSSISKEEEDLLDEGKDIKIDRGNRTFTVQAKKLYCYGEVDFNNGSNDLAEINTFNFLEHLDSFTGACICSDYDYKNHHYFQNQHFAPLQNRLQFQNLLQHQ